MAAVAVRGGEEIAEPAIKMVGAFMGGSLQRVAWNTSNALGFFTTGLMLAAGTVGAMMMDGLGKAAMEGVAMAGATLGGWILTEKFLIPGAAAPGQGALGQSASRAEQLAQRMRSQLGNGQQGRYPAPAFEEQFESVRLR